MQKVDMEELPVNEILLASMLFFAAFICAFVEIFIGQNDNQQNSECIVGALGGFGIWGLRKSKK